MQGGKLKNYERWTPWRKNRKEKEEKIKIKNKKYKKVRDCEGS